MKKSYPNSKECTIAILKENYNWNDPIESENPIEYIKKFLENYKKYFRYKISDNGFIINHDFDYNENSWSADIKYIYNPNNDFDSFASSASTHDGTLLFVVENIEKCIHDLIYLSLKEFGKKITSPINQGDEVEIVFGDITIADGIKPEFGTKEKPWRTNRTIVVIPTKAIIKRAIKR